MASPNKFLPTLTASLSKTAQNDPPRTMDFVDTMDGVVPIFEHLGGALTFAKSDILAKNKSLTEAAPEHETLLQIVDSCKAAGTVTKKDSLARNLHRLRTVVVFMERIMAQLVDDPKLALSSAVSTAYGETLSKFHSMVVRGSCNAGFLLLPTRATFLASIGETEESAKQHVPEFVQAARKVVADVDKLYDCEMPASSAWL